MVVTSLSSCNEIACNDLQIFFVCLVFYFLKQGDAGSDKYLGCSKPEVIPQDGGIQNFSFSPIFLQET